MLYMFGNGILTSLSLKNGREINKDASVYQFQMQDEAFIFSLLFWFVYL